MIVFIAPSILNPISNFKRSYECGDYSSELWYDWAYLITKRTFHPLCFTRVRQSGPNQSQQKQRSKEDDKVHHRAVACGNFCVVDVLLKQTGMTIRIYTRWWPHSIAKLVYNSNNYGLCLISN